MRNAWAMAASELFVRAFHCAILSAVDTGSDELVILDVRHAARRWPWQLTLARAVKVID
jgi:hypothetical protein